MPNSYRTVRDAVAQARPEGGWSLPATVTDRQGFWATFEFSEQLVGWPCFTIEAPAGTIVEVLTQESHAAGRPGLARYALLRLDAFRLPRGRQPVREFRLRVAPLAATARPQRKSPGCDPRRRRPPPPVRLAQRASRPLRRTGLATAV